MDILRVFESFSNPSADHKLVVTIGKSISRHCFSINNKIFFDILKTYLQKNGWYLNTQRLSKKYYHRNRFLESITVKEPSVVADFDVPVTQTATLYEIEQDQTKKFRGTYFDIFCQQTSTKVIEDMTEFTGHSHLVFSEIQEEVSVFKKTNSSLDVIFSVNKEKEPYVFSVRIEIFSMNELEKEEFLELFEIVELAMSKYKKTDKTISSAFQVA
ncbi:MAG: hypothetical protein F2873_10270 [Actinobacteria bacterium]|uniref:Unannotated protein n=1 Tax=freshwater metagenome TaxID=449393 RepID=A0A6J7PKA5_9ZZZZ|nr:hypothetical protein [Actinomycetota bacterium]